MSPELPYMRLFNDEASNVFKGMPLSSDSLKKAEYAAFGMRPNNPEDFENLGDITGTAALAPPLSVVAAPLSVLFHGIAGYMKGDYSSLVIDALSTYTDRVMKYVGIGETAAGFIAYGTGKLAETKRNEKKE